MQLALAEGDAGTLERHRRRVVEIAMLLEEKSTIPAVAAQLSYLAALQENAFWEGVGLDGLEELRLRLRGLVPFLDKRRARSSTPTSGTRSRPCARTPPSTCRR